MAEGEEAVDIASNGAAVDAATLTAESEAVAADLPTSDTEDLDLGYQVQLTAFSGPLDLLLHLVRKSEVDITEISIVQIADQFIAAIQTWDSTDLEMAGDFILMAATLLEMKARSIAPLRSDDEEETEEEDWIDPRADLVRQLLAFRKTKDAVSWMEQLEEQRYRLHHRRFSEQIPEDPSEADAIDLDNADPYLLYQTWEAILKSVAGHRQRTVVYDDIPIDERVKKIEQVMRTTREAQLAWLLGQEEKPIARVGVVVASLEALRKRVMEATQHQQYGPVHLHYLDTEQREWKVLEPEAETDAPAPKRRRRPPLFTWRPPEGGEAAIDDQTTPLEDEAEIVVESDEQRFVRELNEHCAVDALLDRVRNLDSHLQERLRAEGVIEPAAEGGADEVAVVATAETAEPATASEGPAAESTK